MTFVLPYRVIIPVTMRTCTRIIFLLKLKNGDPNLKPVLIVDDNPAQQKVLSMLVKHIGLSAHVARNAGEALEVLDRAPHGYALVLMDWRMYDIDGLECTKRIRNREIKTGQRIPIIAITACATKGDREACLEAGMDDYLSKPFSLEQFRTVVGLWFEKTLI